MHPPLRVRRRFSICISLSPSCIYSRHLIPLHQPSLSFSPSPPFRKGTQLNSQRPHREESVNATGKRERENVELLRAYVSRLLKSFSSCRNSNFVAFTWANLRAEARQAKRDVGIIHFDGGDIELCQLVVIYLRNKSLLINFNQGSVLIYFQKFTTKNKLELCRSDI